MRVAAVSRDVDARLELARAFDAAPSGWHIALHTNAPDDADVVVFGPDMKAPDGIVFDPGDPSALIPAIEATLAKEAPNKLFVVTGTGGGVGVTSVALHLALNAARSHKTCCIGGPDVALRLDLPPDVPTRTDANEIDRVAVPVAGGFRVLLSDDPTAPSEATSRFDAVISDTPRPDEASLAHARAAVLVCPPTVPGARRARDLIRQHEGVKWAVVTNRVGPGGEMTRHALEQILECHIAVELPACAPLRDAEDDGRLLDSTLYRWPRRMTKLWTALERV
ncbi:MAG: hypothetical protein ACRDKT_06235 [Actinomycetota bacterium]